MEEKWKELKQCYDYEKLKECFSDEMLDIFEEEIEAYLNDEIDPEDETLAVCWYTGCITTEDLISEYHCV